MNKKAYYRDLIELNEALENDSFRDFFYVVKIFSNVNKTASNLDFVAFKNPSSNNQHNSMSNDERQKFTNAISQAIILDKTTTNYMSFAASYFQLQQLINKSLEHETSSSSLKTLLGEFLGLMNDFSVVFGRYRQDYSPAEVYKMSFIADQLADTSRVLKLLISTIISFYRPDDHINDNSRQLELYLSNVSSLKKFGIKLQVLDEMYAEICMLLNLSVADHPIIIEHIENGSLLARISGSNLAVGIITTILNASANYYIAHYPANGEIVEIKETIETLDKMYELTEKLEAGGYDVNEMQDDIHRSLRKLSKSTDILLGDQPEIEVNDRIFQLDQENATKLLQETKLLEVKDFDQEA